MRRQIVLILLLLASLGYAGYIYWPVLSGYLPDLFETRPEIRPDRIEQPADEPVETEAKTTAGPAASPEAVVKKKVIKDLVDPFALRINIRSKAETPKEDKKEVAKEPEPELEGIWVDSGMRVAFISNQAVIEGGLVMGWRVTRITKTQVTLKKGSRRKILKLEAIQ